jgi:hypothetical protein
MKPLLDRGGPGPDDEGDFPIGPRRTAQEVARRAIILCCVTASLEFEPGTFNGWLKREGLWDEVSPIEVALLSAEEPTDRQRINASWRSEALQALLWALEKVKKLPPLTDSYISGMLECLPAPGEDTKEFIASAQLRPEDEIDEALEAIVDAHWQLRNEDAYPDEKAAPMDRGVVVERHWALAWIVNVDDEPWDQTPLTT